MTVGQSERVRISKKIRELREERGWSQDELAKKVGVQFETVNRWENKPMRPRAQHLSRLCAVLGVSMAELKGLSPARPAVPLDLIENPAPMGSAHISVPGAYVMYEADNKPIDWTVTYRHEKFVRHPDLDPYWDILCDHVRERAKEVGTQFWNGPVVRLTHLSFEQSGETRGHEFSRVTFNLAPLSWEEFSVLHTLFYDDVFDEPPRTIRERYCDLTALYRNQSDLRWCQLSNLLCVHLIPITSDGFGLVKRRGRGNSLEIDVLIAGVDENLHRYNDEADPHDLYKRRNFIVDPSREEIDAWFAPKGVPSPYLCALRGIGEETSPHIERALTGFPQRIKFLSVVMDLKMFHPHLCGVAELPFTKDETQKLLADHPGVHLRTEARSHQYVPLDFLHPMTKQLVADQRDWSAAGLAALVSAEKYWRASSK